MTYHRTGLIVWMHSLKQVKALKRYGNIHYVSKGMQYVVLYCDERTCDHTIKQLNALSHVQKVQKSLRAFLATDYSDTNQLETRG